MRPIQLVMQAFGPYSKREVVDFRKLGGNTLFLITGPTGSGKTTIFDAICFALYGETSGNIRAPEQLRSQFSSPDIMTEVMLEFELRGISYHIHRIPKQEKPKSRGQGYTEQKPEASLISDTKGQRKVHTGVINVNNQIESIIGINAEQFRQIMMIPQGEFQKLLIADSQEREKVLRKLFDTSIYRLFQQNIDERAKDLYGDIKSIQQLRQHEIKRIDYGEDETLKNLLDQQRLNGNEILERAKVFIQKDCQETKHLAREIKKLEKEIEAIIQEREKANENNGKLLRLEHIKDQLEKLQDNQENIVLLQEQIDVSQRASSLIPVEDYWKQRKNEVEKLEKMKESLYKEKESIEKEFVSIKNKLEKLQSDEKEDEREKSKQELIKLQTYMDKVKQFKSIEETIETSQQKLDKLEKQKREVEETFTKNKDDIKRLSIERENGSKAKIKMLEIREVISQSSGRIKSYSQAREWLISEAKQVKEYQQEQKGYAENLQQMTIAERNFKEHRLHFLMNQAALLAKDLEEGMPCPVCGATEHINLAKPTEDFVTEDELNTYEKEYERIRNRQQTLEQMCTTKKEQLKNLREKIRSLFAEELQINDIDLAEVEDAIQKEQDKKSDLELIFAEQEKMIKRTQNHDQKIHELEKEQIDLEKTHKQVDDQWMKAQEEKIEQSTIFKQLCEEVPEHYRKENVLEEAIESLLVWIEEDRKQVLSMMKEHDSVKEKRLNIITMVSEHEKRLDDARTYEGEAYKDFMIQLENKRFESVEAYELGKLSDENVLAKQKQVEAYTKEKSALISQKEQLEKESKQLQVVDIEVYEKRLYQRKEDRVKLDETFNQKKYRYEHNQKILELVGSYQSQIGEKEAKYAVLGNLAQVAQGNNPLRISFERYVLAAFLEDVLTAANMRLTKMTFGRYSLHRSDDLERKNRQSGLELQVFDNYTGKMRHVKTLSGGESFKTSLAMALGLSDVVQSYTGGIQLDTMFVDEGFGTLDQESLDSAINCLVDLQKRGRLIGIISHVQELKERIESRLEIYSTQTGSRTEFV